MYNIYDENYELVEDFFHLMRMYVLIMKGKFLITELAVEGFGFGVDGLQCRKYNTFSTICSYIETFLKEGFASHHSVNNRNNNNNNSNSITNDSSTSSRSNNNNNENNNDNNNNNNNGLNNSFLNHTRNMDESQMRAILMVDNVLRENGKRIVSIVLNGIGGK